jgi:lipoprotein-anchoring transpeptidase ErfK/SrfK
VNLSDYEMTLTVGGRYAGRFAIGVGEDCARVANSQTFLVSGKTANPTYYGPGNEQIGAGDPNNPLGRYYLTLSDPNGAPTRISIHGTNSPVNLHQTGGRGSICLGAQDVKDIFEILSAGPVPPSPNGPVASKVTIVH